MSVYQEGLGNRNNGEAAQQFKINMTKRPPAKETAPLESRLGTAVVTREENGDYRLAVLNHTNSARSTIHTHEDLIPTLSKLQHEAGVAKLMGVGIQTKGKDDSIRHTLWQEMDTVPIRLGSQTIEDPKKDDIDIAKDIRSFFTEKGTPVIDSDKKTGEIHSSRIATLPDWEKSYQEMGHEAFWDESMQEIDHFAKELQGKRLVRINTTAQAGGVAGMLHPAKRFIDEYNALQEEKGEDGHPIDFHWHTMNGHIDPEIAAKHDISLDDPELIAKYGNPEKPEDGLNVFKITKKMHNIIQGQERPGEEFTETDKKIHAAWSETQSDRLQDVLNQPDTVYWIDDQQPLGLIQRIRENDPHAPVIFRFHIQVRNDMAKRPGSQQKEVIDFLMDKMTGANNVDAFLSHRSKDGEMDDFLPKDADGNIDPRIADKVMYKVATADTEDGLGKELTDKQREYYLQGINDYLQKDGQTPIDMSVGHIGQFARFDRAKNIPTVLASYKEFTDKMLADGKILAEVPEQLVVGFGAVDNPDGEGILTETHDQIAKLYPELTDKIKVIRLTYDKFDDRHMKALEETCDIGLQLSTAEGCEDKITQMLMQGKPMIVANVGGMPPQLQDGINGHLVEMLGDDNTVLPEAHKNVAQHLYDYYTETYADPEKRQKVAQTACETVNPEYTTIANVRDMAGIAAMVATKKEEIPHAIDVQQQQLGRIPFVKEVIDSEYQRHKTQDALLPPKGDVYVAA